MSLRRVDKKECCGCLSKKTTARCAGCQSPLCGSCKKACTLCDTCVEHFHKEVFAQEHEIRLKMSVPVMFGEPDLAELDFFDEEEEEDDQLDLATKRLVDHLCPA